MQGIYCPAANKIHTHSVHLRPEDDCPETVRSEDWSFSSSYTDKREELCREMIRMKKYYSTESIFGGRNIYDENGHLVGYSTENIFGGENFYNADGSSAGFSTESVLGGENIYDKSGSLKAFSTDSVFGGRNINNADGSPAGFTTEGLFGGENGYFDDDPFGPSDDI